MPPSKESQSPSIFHGNQNSQGVLGWETFGGQNNRCDVLPCVRKSQSQRNRDTWCTQVKIFRCALCGEGIIIIVRTQSPLPGVEKAHTIRNIRIKYLIPLDVFDVMRMKSLRKFIPPEFSDVMITYVACKKRWGKEMQIWREFLDVNQNEIITRTHSLKINWWNVILEFPMVRKNHTQFQEKKTLDGGLRISWDNLAGRSLFVPFFPELVRSSTENVFRCGGPLCPTGPEKPGEFKLAEKPSTL